MYHGKNTGKPGTCKQTLLSLKKLKLKPSVSGFNLKRRSSGAGELSRLRVSELSAACDDEAAHYSKRMPRHPF